MPFVPGFKYDLFISYAHKNDRPWRWVLRRKARLAHALDAALKISRIFVWKDAPLPLECCWNCSAQTAGGFSCRGIAPKRGFCRSGLLFPVHASGLIRIPRYASGSAGMPSRNLP